VATLTLPPPPPWPVLLGVEITALVALLLGLAAFPMALAGRQMGEAANRDQPTRQRWALVSYSTEREAAIGGRSAGNWASPSCGPGACDENGVLSQLRL
jgi:hypothetical protein